MVVIAKKRGRKKGFKFPPVTLSPTATIIKPNQQQFITGVSKSTAYRLEKAGQFPQRRKLSVQAVGWLRSELEAWRDSRLAVVGEAVAGV